MANIRNSEFEIIHHTSIPKMNFYLTDSNYCSAHIHSDLEILFLIEGEIEITTQTEVFSLTSGEMAVFNPYQVHSYKSLADVPIILVIQINPTFCRPYYPQLENIRFETSNISRIIPPKYFSAMANICFDIGYNYFSEVLAYEFRCIGDVNRLIVVLLTFVPFQILTDQELASATKLEKRVERMMTYIDHHFQEKISLAEIAQKEKLSVAYLSRFFKLQIGQSFQNYVSALRLEHAAYLLSNTNKTILDISIESGFSDLKYMTKAFSEKFHMTAGEFRRLRKGSLMASGLEKSEGVVSFSKTESLFIMRKFHHYDCDDDDSPNRIYNN